nr:putative reverse transcriptase domain-containing protein [Tanacetum cinerariifolium]
MPPKRTSTSEAPAMTQAAIRQLVVDSVAIALETQAATMKNADNANRNPEPREAPVARKCSYKEFMSCQPFNFKGSECAIGLIRWFERTESVFSCSNCIEDCKELATLCPTMVSNSKKLLEAFIGGLPQSIEGNVTTPKPQNLVEAINMAQRLMDQGKAYLLKDRNTYQDLNVVTVVEKKSDEKRLEDVPIVKEFLDIFSEDLPGLPPIRQVEFQINLIPGTTPVACAPYRLAPSEMQELSNQLQELIDQGFIRPRLHVDPAKIEAVKNWETPTTPTEIGTVAYKLELPEELSNVHNTFHVSNLKKCLSNESLVIPMKELQLDEKLNFVEEPVEIMNQEVKQLRQSRIPIIK